MLRAEIDLGNDGQGSDWRSTFFGVSMAAAARRELREFRDRQRALGVKTVSRSAAGGFAPQD